jgi:hypothetical protein
MRVWVTSTRPRAARHGTIDAQLRLLMPATDTAEIEVMKSLAAQYPRYGYRCNRVSMLRQGIDLAGSAHTGGDTAPSPIRESGQLPLTEPTPGEASLRHVLTSGLLCSVDAGASRIAAMTFISLPHFGTCTGPRGRSGHFGSSRKAQMRLVPLLRSAEPLERRRVDCAQTACSVCPRAAPAAQPGR